MASVDIGDIRPLGLVRAPSWWASSFWSLSVCESSPDPELLSLKVLDQEEKEQNDQLSSAVPGPLFGGVSR